MDPATCALWGVSGEECLFPYIFHLFIHLLFLLFTKFGPAKKTLNILTLTRIIVPKSIINISQHLKLERANYVDKANVAYLIG